MSVLLAKAETQKNVPGIPPPPNPPNISDLKNGFFTFFLLQYFSYNGILVLVAISVLVQLSHALKVMLNLAILTTYCVFNMGNNDFMYDNFDTYVYLNRTR